MKSVIIIFAISHENDNQIIGVAESNKAAIELIKKSGYGWGIEQDELQMLEILGYTINRNINFKFENWEVHGNFN